MSRLEKNIVLRKEFDGSGILLNSRNGVIFTLNRTAVCICEALEKGSSDQEILAELASLTTLPPDAEKDLQKFLIQLRDRGYLAK